MMFDIFGHAIDFLTVVLVVAIVFVIWKVSKLNRDPHNKFDVLDLFMENERLSKAAVVMMGSYALTTWLMIYLALHDKLTEGYFGLYATAWIAPVVVRLITGGAPTPQIMPNQNQPGFQPRPWGAPPPYQPPPYQPPPYQAPAPYQTPAPAPVPPANLKPNPDPNFGPDPELPNK